MKRSAVLILLAPLASCQPPGAAAEKIVHDDSHAIGRYRMERIGNDGTQVYVLDTREGFLTYCATRMGDNAPECGPKTSVQ